MIGSARMVDGLYYLDGSFSSGNRAQGLSSISSISIRDQIML